MSLHDEAGLGLAPVANADAEEGHLPGAPVGQVRGGQDPRQESDPGNPDQRL